MRVRNHRASPPLVRSLAATLTLAVIATSGTPSAGAVTSPSGPLAPLSVGFGVGGGWPGHGSGYFQGQLAIGRMLQTYTLFASYPGHAGFWFRFGQHWEGGVPQRTGWAMVSGFGFEVGWYDPARRDFDARGDLAVTIGQIPSADHRVRWSFSLRTVFGGYTGFILPLEVNALVRIPRSQFAVNLRVRGGPIVAWQAIPVTGFAEASVGVVWLVPIRN